MARRTSKNRWVNGKRILKWFANSSEFAGGSECGTKIPIGELGIEDETVERLEVFTVYEKDQAVELFLRCGVVIEPNEFTDEDVFDIIHQALRQSNDNRINDVGIEKRPTWFNGSSGRQIILTTDNGNVKQRFIIEAESIVETD